MFGRRGLQVFLKRDDLLHPHVSGNKWRKLKYNLAEARRLGFSKLFTFGGAYSNHLAAVAAAGRECGFQTTGAVRGEMHEALNPTLRFASSCGMGLLYVSRGDFRLKDAGAILRSHGLEPNDFYILPEGGSNSFAVQGCREIVGEAAAQLGFLPDYFCVACGTGATLAGIVAGLHGRGEALGVAVLKGDFLKKEVANLLESCNEPVWENWSIRIDYHFGGYAKFSPDLIDFINDFKRRFDVPLDPVYTGKLCYAVFDLAEKNFFREGSTVLVVHTGGLQGVEGFNERFGNLIE